MYIEPEHDIGIKSTLSSKKEGRLKNNVSFVKKKKRKILRKFIEEKKKYG